MTVQRRLPISILCIDDGASCLEANKRLLEKAGYDVLESSYGEHGLMLFSSAPIDLVMIDDSMGMNGASMACSMRRQKPDVPIMMVSGRAEHPDYANSWADAYICKNAGFEDLLPEIERLLDRRTREARRLWAGSDGRSRARQDFFSLKGEALNRFERMGMEISYAGGERLFTEGEIQQYVFILLSGHVKLTAGSQEDEMASFRTAEAGNILGLSAALNAGDCEATAEALESCRVRIIYTKEFIGFLEKYPEASREATRCLLKEYEGTLDDIRGLTWTNALAG